MLENPRGRLDGLRHVGSPFGVEAAGAIGIAVHSAFFEQSELAEALSILPFIYC
jgi:hypothetical protein